MRPTFTIDRGHEPTDITVRFLSGDGRPLEQHTRWYGPGAGPVVEGSLPMGAFFVEYRSHEATSDQRWSRAEVHWDGARGRVHPVRTLLAAIVPRRIVPAFATH